VLRNVPPHPPRFLKGLGYLTKLLHYFRLGLLKSKLLVFVIISLIWTLIPQKLPLSTYNYRRWLYRERPWERGGEIYQKFFRVRRWKAKLPDIGDFFKWRFSKKHLKKPSQSYIETFLTESCKAEFAHWMIILSSPVFLLLGGPKSFAQFFLISVALNLPYIIIQRYNRPRLIKLLVKDSAAGCDLAAAKA
jgi:glycosyl-4,4'-diaponeurosporenoate acyltransferase